ncbi:MAG: glycosyltransferase [Candidatus Saccharimonas aalborgensis]
MLNNRTSSKRRFIILRGIKPKNGVLSFDIKTTSGDINILLLNKKLKYVTKVVNNAANSISNLRNSAYYIGFTLPQHTSAKITQLSVTDCQTEEELTNEMIASFAGKVLVITPGYPSPGNLYDHAFIHTRLRLYRKYGLKDIDVAVVNGANISHRSQYEMDGITVSNIGYNDVRIILQQRHYDKIFVHFFGLKYAQILDASDMTMTNIFIYTHGGDVLYRDYSTIARTYFTSPAEISVHLKKQFDERDALLRRYNSYDNVRWIFSTEWCRNRAEILLGEQFRQSYIIPNPIDSDVFSYRPRKAEDRKKICIARPFNNLSSYANDISVRTILELSKRPFFSELSFDIYGTGEIHKLLVQPLRHLQNVTIHNSFLNSTELAKTFQHSGIVLMPTRYDTQGVAACEAAMTGAVVIGSDGDVGVKDCIDPTLGTYCPTEDFNAYADKIEDFYKHADKFLDVSKKMHEFTYAKCGEDQSINKEVALIKSVGKYEKMLTFKSKSKSPVLTIAVPSYNVEQYLKNGVMSLLDHPLAHKLEVIVINDGSIDKTAEIGLWLEKFSSTENGPIVKIVNKKNGGHGSTINTGIRLATGKYFKLMDGDDYFITDNLTSLIQILENESSDIILTNYIEDFSIDAIKHPVRHYDFLTEGLRYDLDAMQYRGYGFAEWGPLLSTTTCKTEILKKAGFKIDENAFYVDMEYNFIIYALSKTVSYYPLDIYNYYLGRSGQSMSRESFTRNYLHHEKVTMRLIEEFYARKDSLSPGKQQYLIDKLIIPMCKTQYMICTEYHANRRPFESFDSKLGDFPELYYDNEIAGRVIRLHRLSKGSTVRVNAPIRKAIRTIWHPIKRKFI